MICMHAEGLLLGLSLQGWLFCVTLLALPVPLLPSPTRQGDDVVEPYIAKFQMLQVLNTFQIEGGRMMDALMMMPFHRL